MKHALLPLALVFLFASCQDEELITHQDLCDDLSQEASNVPQLIIGTEVYYDEINKIAQSLGIENDSKGRSEEYTTDFIYDKNGAPSIIIVNYNNDSGYLLVSAKKSHYPILAYSKNGNFHKDNCTGGLCEWIESMVNEISEGNNNDTTSINKAKSDWQCFAPQHIGNFNNSHHSREISYDEYMELQNIFQDSLDSWRSKGYTVYSMREYVDMDPEGHAWAEVTDAGVYPQYWEDVDRISFVVLRDEPGPDNNGYLTINWGQSHPYNSQIERYRSNGARAYVGCGPLAVAMVMASHKHPSTFNWSSINYSGYSDALGYLLKSIFDHSSPIVSDSGTSTTTSNLKNVLNYYRYNASESNYSLSTLNNSLSSCGPTIVASSYTLDGETRYHAWVVRARHINVVYHIEEVWTFMHRNSFERFAWRQTHSEFYNYAINWGWNGTNDGLYSSPAAVKPQGATNNSLNILINNISPK